MTGVISIGSADALYCVSDSEATLDRDYLLTADIDLSVLSVDTAWRPIGSVSAFTGSLDGNGKTISGLNLQLAGTSDLDDGTVRVGLFASVSGATISNLTLASPVVAGGARVGGLVGEAANSSISEVTVKSATVTADRAEGRVGGLIGYMDNTRVADVSVTGTVQALHVGSAEAGGVIGRINATPGDGSQAPITTVVNADFDGDVSGPDSVGGVIGGGDTDPTNSTKWMALTNLRSSGSVSSTVPFDREVDWNWAVGGAIGAIFDSELSEIHSTSEVTASTTEVGGLIGSLADSPLRHASATGDVTVNLSGGWCGAGGLIGSATRWFLSGTPIIVDDVSASGDVSCVGGEAIGGLVGYTDNTDFSNGEALGNVTGTGSLASNVGGFAGSAYDSTFTDVSAVGNVSGESHSVGGLIGGAYRNGPSDDGFAQPRDVVITRATTSGQVSGRTDVGGLVAHGQVNDTTGSIRVIESSSSSPVKGLQSVGGIAGTGDFLLRDVVSTGAITGWVTTDGSPSPDAAYYGGLVGFLSATGSIQRSFTTSTITTDYDPTSLTFGSMIGVADGTLTGLSFTATNPSELRVAGQIPDSQGTKAVYKSLSELGQLATYTSWNSPETVIVAGWVPSPRSTEVWGTCTDVASGLPFLQWQRSAACATTSGPAPTPQPAPSQGGAGSGSGAAPSSETPTRPATTPMPPSGGNAVPSPSSGLQPVFRQPVVAQRLTGTVALVPAKIAATTPVRTLRQEPSPLIGSAPTVSAGLNQPVKLLVQGFTPGAGYIVQLKSRTGYVVLGTVVANASGQLELPVFQSSRPGESTIAVVASSGRASYVKVNTSTGKKKAGAGSAKSSTTSARASAAVSAGRR